jgi:hypothetical protein
MIVIGVVVSHHQEKTPAAQILADKVSNIFQVATICVAKCENRGSKLLGQTSQVFRPRCAKKFGMEYPYNELIKEIDRDTVTSGMRNTTEIKTLREHFGKILI